MITKPCQHNRVLGRGTDTSTCTEHTSGLLYLRRHGRFKMQPTQPNGVANLKNGLYKIIKRKCFSDAELAEIIQELGSTLVVIIVIQDT